MAQPRSRTARGPRRKLPVPWPILVLIVLAVGATVYTWAAPSAAAAEHPEPRAGIAVERLQPPERYAADPRVAEVYAMVAEIPEVVDGIYCYCHCAHHADHYSLLTCYEDDHGANCDVCLEQARIAHAMTRQGASLEEIRLAVDQRFAR